MPPAKPQLFDKNEFVKTLAIMAPLYVAYLMNAGMSIIDTIVAGSIDAQNLAGVAIGASICWPIIISLGASLTIVGPMVSRLRGEGRAKQIGVLINNAKSIGVVLSLLACLLLYLGTSIFPHISETPETSRIATHYVYFMLLGVPAAILMRVISAYFEGHDQTRPAMLMAIIALLANYPLNYAFAHGWGPFPALGGAGCGLATSIVTWLSMLGLLAIMLITRRHKQNALSLLHLQQVNKRVAKAIFHLGYPISIATFCEMTFFCAISLIIAPLGNIAISAQQIALNISMVAFTLPLTLSIASSIRSSYHIGTKDQVRFNNLVSTLLISLLCTVCLTIVIIVAFRYEILAPFTQSAEIIEIAQHLLILCAVYQIPDGLQAIYHGLLRGCHDTKILSKVNLFTYWVIGFPLSYTLIRTDWIVPAMGAAGAWVSFIVALSCTALLLALRFYYTKGKLIQKGALLASEPPQASPPKDL